jgi:hypothetical protein
VCHPWPEWTFRWDLTCFVLDSLIELYAGERGDVWLAFAGSARSGSR